MHPEVKSGKPGQCSKCGMDLVNADESSTSCCSKHAVEADVSGMDEEKPKPFVERFLYDLGKKDFERNKGKKKGCC